MAWPGAHTASDKCPDAQKQVWLYETRFSLWTYTVEDLEFLDIPVHVHMHVVTMHEYKTIMTVLFTSVRQIMVLPMYNFVRNVAHVRFFRFFSITALNQENFYYN